MEMDDFRVFFFASFCPVWDEGTGICFLGCPVLSCERCILADANSRESFFLSHFFWLNLKTSGLSGVPEGLVFLFLLDHA